MAHGAVLRKNFFNEEELTSIVEDFTNAGLPEVEVAVMNLAQKVVRSAHKVSNADIEHLRTFGLEDAEIFDVILTAAARCFFGHALDAAGIEPDDAYLEDLEGNLPDVLSVGRPWQSGESAADQES
jgi:alkylhydroperoxidase family enzyme